MYNQQGKAQNIITIYTEGYSESTEPIAAVNILPLARFEPTFSTTPSSTTPDIDKDVQEALILTTPDAVHVVYWYIYIYVDTRVSQITSANMTFSFEKLNIS